MKDGFIKIALAAPKIRVADTEYNAELCVAAAKAAAEAGAVAIVFPELVLTGATSGDLFYSDALIDGAYAAIKKFEKETAELDIISFIGAPVRVDSALFDASLAICRGAIDCVSAARELSFAKQRYFASGRMFDGTSSLFVNVCGEDVVLCAEQPIYEILGTRARFFVAVGDDVRYAEAAARHGANIIINPFAESECVGISKKRRVNAKSLTDSYSCAYIGCGAGLGESGTDGIYTAPRIAASLGEILIEAEPFGTENIYVTLDVAMCEAARKRSPEMYSEHSEEFHKAYCSMFDGRELPTVDTPRVCKSPFSCDKADCDFALELQARALAERMERAYAKTAVIGVSGGLDSTLALLVCARAADILGRARESVIAITMPCFGTSKRTKSNALTLASELGCTVRTVDIKAAVERHFKDIGHDKDNYNVVYENAQARERTQILMDVANAEGGMVIGTGDLSELALGFATYNGDHMSMYGVNASIPKTLMRDIIRTAAEKLLLEGKTKLARALIDVVETPVSPELLPISGTENAQYTEEIVGPYELHDFFLYYAVRYGFTKEKIKRLATVAFCPDYSEDEIGRYLDIFFRRFISQQFKRSCLPDGPRVTEISLSPRGAWCMPSDAVGSLWNK